MAKPINSALPPFDAAHEQWFGFTWTGNQSYKNRLIIKNASSLVEVYNNTVTTMELGQTLPANTLTNGIEYVRQFVSIDQNNVESTISDITTFKCYTTPTFQFSNVTDNSTVNNVMLTATLTYSQEQYEQLYKYMFYLYDSTKTLLNSSDELYDEISLSYVFKGLLNTKTYYIRATGTTQNGIEVDTGYIKINIEYENPDSYARIYAEFNPDTGSLDYHTNINVVQYNGTEIFDYDNGIIDLTTKKLYYDEGFKIANDFCIIIRGKNLWSANNKFNAIDENNNVISFEIKRYDNGAKVKVQDCNYVIFNKGYLQYTDDDMACIRIIRVDGLYQIDTYIDFNYIDVVPNVYLGKDLPVGVAQYDVWFNDGVTTPNIRTDGSTLKYYFGATDLSMLNTGDILYKYDE